MRSKLFRANFFAIFTVVLAILFSPSSVVAQASSFTYQGRLADGGTAANGNYDLQFALFDSLSGGTQIGSTQTINTVAVSNGVFTVSLDFGTNSFSGANRFLEISARPSGAGSFTLLTPRQPVTATPYAVRSANASAADALSSACSGSTATNATQLGGIAAGQFVQTNDTRLADSRSPTPGSTNYIQTNPSSTQSANFNVSGNGTVGGTLSGSIVNAATQFNIGGIRAFGVSGSSQEPNSNTFAGDGAGGAITPLNNGSGLGSGNSFFGKGAGQATSTGLSNSFFGFNAGNQNTTGVANSFFGTRAGFANVSGGSNAFFGNFAGSANTGSGNAFFGNVAGGDNTTGSNNVFIGMAAGAFNSTGSFNTFIGGQNSKGNDTGGRNSTGSGNTVVGNVADVGAGNLTNATAIGANALVAVSNALVLGSINGLNNATADTNVGIGTTTPAFRLHVVDPGAAGLRVQTNTGGGAVASFGGFGDFQIDSNGLAGGRFVVQQAGRVGISTNAPTSTLSVNGTADKPGGGSWGTFSDERLKNIKGRFTSGLKAALQLQPLRYEYKRDNALNLKSEGEHIGFSAQAVRKIIPEAVSQNDKGYLLVNNDPILWTMLNAIKEQQGQIDTLRTANAALNARLRALEKSRRKRVSSRRSRD